MWSKLDKIDKEYIRGYNTINENERLPEMLDNIKLDNFIENLNTIHLNEKSRNANE